MLSHHGHQRRRAIASTRTDCILSHDVWPQDPIRQSLKARKVMTLMQCTCYGYISSCWYGNRTLQYRMLPAVPFTARLCSAGPSLAAAFIAIAMACQQIIAQSAYYVASPIHSHPSSAFCSPRHCRHRAYAMLQHIMVAIQACVKAKLLIRVTMPSISLPQSNFI